MVVFVNYLHVLSKTDANRLHVHTTIDLDYLTAYVA